MSQRAQRICIVGAGAAGLAAAWSLGRTGRFDVTLYEAGDHVGGVATTIPLDDPGGSSWLNNQVQAGSPGFHNTRRFFTEFGFGFNPVRMQIAIGTGEFAWNNQVATPFITRMQPEIAKFHRLLLKVRAFPFPFMFVSIGTLLRLNGFSPSFMRQVIHPLMSLFFAAGADALRVPAAAVAQLVLDEDAKMFDFEGDTLLSKAPVMAAFPKLSEVYDKVAAASGARIHLRRRAMALVREPDRVTVTDDRSESAVFDAVVLACPPQAALTLLGRPSMLERMVLGRIRSVPAEIVIHSDEAYLQRHYRPDPGLGAQYHVRYPRDANSNAIEMTYHMTAYQDQLRLLSKNIYQTIDPLDELDPASIIERRTVTSILHTCTHFTSIVPLWRFLQGRRRTWYCGGHTMFNIHEIALVSGLAVAHKLGSPYPYAAEPDASKMFDMYLGLVHG